MESEAGRLTACGVSLRLKVTTAFVLIVVLGTAVCTLIGSRIVTEAMRGEAQKRVRYGLETARMVYALRQDRVRRAVVRSAAALAGLEVGGAEDRPAVAAALGEQGATGGLDFVGLLDAEGGLTTPARTEALPPERRAALRDVAQTARDLATREVAGTEVLDRAFLLEAHPGLTRLPGPDDPESVELVLLSASAVGPAATPSRIVYGGVLLGRNHALVDEIKQAVFGSETHDGRSVGAVSIALGDVRVSTNVMVEPGVRALGTRVSSDMADAVRRDGVPSTGRTRIVNDWYVSAFEPLRDRTGRTIGMLGVGVLEAQYLAVRTSMMLTFLGVAGVGVVILVLLTYVTTRTIIRPLEEMAAASERIATGDMERPVHVRSRDEIGHLAWSFNRMQESLKKARGELEEWARTLEDRVKLRTEELVAVQSQMVQAEKLASLGRMAAAVAHEINNPLGGIMTFASLALEECADDDPLRGNLDIIVQQSHRCREIVRGLLEFARQSAALVTPTNVNDVVGKALSLLEAQESFHNLRTERRLDPDLPQVLIDASQLQQVFVNLVVNAVDAMDGTGALAVETAADEETAEVLLRVADTGKGIPKENLPLIFEPFFTTKEVGRGTGLGLAIVHGVVTRAGGRIEVDTSPAGTTFTVRLPRMVQDGTGDGPSSAG